ncbi:FtsH protease activity modulator HflK [Crenothrix polyspora]|uniref:Protein HflK n=1 Tax=Crenothrix polyspora TaxID=360316 RepID=A0A1R4H508_9GAMM|nr:FtsH protease activity modulator HflK [Crenothrix polyspora]SJM91335.1 Protein HflK [Crenothrix polyspora]
MSWNEPGGDKKDPWSGRGDQKGPPDLDEAIRTLQEKLGKIFGGGGGGGDGNNGGAPSQFNPANIIKNLGYVAGIAIGLWGLTGFYIVDEGNHGVETRFGRYIGTTQSGLNWHIPAPFERVDIVNVKKNRVIEVGFSSRSAEQSVANDALMLTKDENIVDVRLGVQYQIKDAKDFMFNMANPEATLIQVTKSAERSVIGSSTMDFVLTEGRSEIVTRIKKEIQNVLDSYKSGLQVTSVNLQDAQPPEQVQNAFADAIKAREDQQRLINEAEAYSNAVVPEARGAAARKEQEAEGYKQQVIAQAEGETSRFTKLLGEYTKAPEVTKKRLYLESMETVLSSTSNVMIDVKAGNNVMYLPLDKIMQQQQAQQPSISSNPVVSSDSNSNLRTSHSQAAVEEAAAAERAVSSRGRENDARGR